MKRTGIVADPIFLEHVAPRHHPETERRLVAIYETIEASGLGERLSRLPLRRASDDEIALVHEQAYIERVESLSGADAHLDADTYMSARTPEVARFAAGGAVDLVGGILAGDLDNGFVLVRPPGHHAEADRGMGFCVYNNIAIAAAAAVEVHGLERVMIIDWDLHHGNGTQHSFYVDDRVLYASTHQYPYYPGTGGVQEIGRGRGEGYTVNVPLPGGQGDADYLYVLESVIAPVAEDFKPQLIGVSAGFDTYSGDPLGLMDVTPEGFGEMAGLLADLAERLCSGRIFYCLEGGYHIEGQAAGVARVLEVLNGEGTAGAIDTSGRRADTAAIVDQVVDRLGRYWRSL